MAVKELLGVKRTVGYSNLGSNIRLQCKETLKIKCMDDHGQLHVFTCQYKLSNLKGIINPILHVFTCLGLYN